MTAQRISTILTAMVTMIRDTFPETYKRVTDGPVVISAIGADDVPLIYIMEFGGPIHHFVTSTKDPELRLLLRHVYNDANNNGRDRMEDLGDMFAADPYINATCLYALVISNEPPYIWPEEGSFNIRDMYIKCRYRRDF